MKRLIRDSSRAEIGLVKGLLERAGVACITKNEQLAGALGDIPFLECEPELWVIHDEDMPRAERILAAHRAPATGAAAWRCRECGELIDGQFEVCWQCGTPDRGA
jgi:rubrerythrin